MQIKRFFTTLITLILAFCWFCFVLGHLIILTTPYTVYFLSNQPIPTFFEPTKLKFRTLNQFLPSRYGAGQNITQNTSSWTAPLAIVTNPQRGLFRWFLFLVLSRLMHVDIIEYICDIWCLDGIRIPSFRNDHTWATTQVHM